MSMKKSYELQVIEMLVEIIREAIRLMPLGTAVRAEWIRKALATLSTLE